MREIKFRGKRLDNGKWVYGYLADENYINDINTIDLSSIEVDSDTVGQYTGLNDANGKEIYEGDIIGGSNGSINGYHWPFTRQIKWDDATCGFNTPKWGYMDSTHYYEILGNIHDNPELMED